MPAKDAVSNGPFVLPTVKKPRLWSPDRPELYQLVVQLYRDEALIDQKTETFGYRWFHFEPHGAFYLNGERLLLRGTHRHEEHAGYGAAIPNALHRRDMEQIKEMGAKQEMFEGEVTNYSMAGDLTLDQLVKHIS